MARLPGFESGSFPSSLGSHFPYVGISPIRPNGLLECGGLPGFSRGLSSLDGSSVPIRFAFRSCVRRYLPSAAMMTEQTPAFSSRIPTASPLGPSRFWRLSTPSATLDHRIFMRFPGCLTRLTWNDQGASVPHFPLLRNLSSPLASESGMPCSHGRGPSTRPSSSFTLTRRFHSRTFRTKSPILHSSGFALAATRFFAAGNCEISGFSRPASDISVSGNPEGRVLRQLP